MDSSLRSEGGLCAVFMEWSEFVFVGWAFVGVRKI